MYVQSTSAQSARNPSSASIEISSEEAKGEFKSSEDNESARSEEHKGSLVRVGDTMLRESAYPESAFSFQSLSQSSTCSLPMTSSFKCSSSDLERAFEGIDLSSSDYLVPGSKGSGASGGGGAGACENGCEPAESTTSEPIPILGSNNHSTSNLDEGLPPDQLVRVNSDINIFFFKIITRIPRDLS